MCNSVETAQTGGRTIDSSIVMPERYASSQRVDSLARVVITPVHHTRPGYILPSQISARPRAAFNMLSWVNFFCLSFTATLSPVFCTEVRHIGTALPVRRTVIGRQCNSVETAETGDRTADPAIVMPERYKSGKRVDASRSVVITPIRHAHTRLLMKCDI